MSIIGSPNSEVRRPSELSLNANSVIGNSPVSSQITSVNSTGNQSLFLAHSEINNQISIAGNRNKLHRNNHDYQALNIHALLKKDYPEISRDMILSALCVGASGNLSQQEINYRPENNLIILSLLTQNEIKREPRLLDSAANLIKKLNTLGEKDSHLKGILNHEERYFDKKIAFVLEQFGQDKLQVISERFVGKYVDPAIKETLGAYFNQEEIDSRPINDFLVSALNYGCEQRAAGAIHEYQQHKRQAFVDKACQIHNLFLTLEEKIETIRPLKVIMDLEKPSAPVESPVQESPSRVNRATGDEIDAGRPHFGSSPSTPLTPSLARSTSHNENMYNTYITNNYYTSPHETASINSVQPRDEENKKPLLPTSFKSVLNVKFASPVTQVSERVRTITERPNINKYQRQAAEKALSESKPLVSKKMGVTETSVITEQPVIAEKSRTNAFASKYTRVTEIDAITGENRRVWRLVGEETKPVTLSERGVLSRNQSGLELYSQTAETENQVQNTVFANRFDAVEVEDEVTGQVKKMWQLADTKTSKPVTLTEMGALTRDQVAKEKYDDAGKRFL